MNFKFVMPDIFQPPCFQPVDPSNLSPINLVVLTGVRRSYQQLMYIAAMPDTLHLLVWVWIVACCAPAHAYKPEVWRMPTHLAGLLADHLRAPAATLTDSTATWQQQFSIQRELHGNGFHQTLEYKVELHSSSLASLQGCRISLLQPLPSSIYADPYQLEDLVRSSSSSVPAGGSSTGESTSYAFKLLGPLDLEL
jgi:hypothetical protein